MEIVPGIRNVVNENSVPREKKIATPSTHKPGKDETIYEGVE